MLIIKILTEVLLLLSALWAAGAAALRWVRFRSTNLADRWLCGAAFSVGYLGLCGLVLGLAGIYNRALLALIMIAPVLLLVYTLRRHPFEPAPKPSKRHRAPQSLAFLNVAAAGLVSLSLVLWFLECITLPFSTWDALVSWDKWASDWGRNWSMRDYLFGGYGQLLPIVSSVLYKMARTDADILPPESFANHALHPVIALVLMVALYRLCVVLEGPPWFGVASFFAWAVIQQMIPYGYTDMLLAAMTTAALVLALDLARGEWRTERHPAWLLSPAYFAAAFAKLIGLFWVALTALVLARRQALKKSPTVPDATLSGSSKKKRSAAKTVFNPEIVQPVRKLWLVYAVALFPVVLFVTQQIWTNAHFEVHRISPFDHMFTFAAVRDSFSGSQRDLIGMPWSAKLSMVVERLIGDGSSGGFSQKLPAIIVGGFLLCASIDRKQRWLLLFAASYLVFYYNTAAYDVRNLVMCLPLLSALAARGYAEISQRSTALFPWSRPVWTTLSIAIFVLFAANLLLAERKHCTLARNGLGIIADRLRNMSAPMPKRAVLLFPEYAPILQFLNETPVYASASHVIAVSPMYRLVRNGVYPFREFTWDFAGQGDLFISPPQFRPVPAQNWILLRNIGDRIWIRQRDDSALPLRALSFTGVHPPRRLSGSTDGGIEFTGNMSLLAVSVPPSSINPGGAYIWKVRVAPLGGRGRIRAFYMTSFGGEINSGINTIGTEVQTEPLVLPGNDDQIYSGILTLQRALPPPAPSDAVLVGLTCNEPGTRVDVREFRFIAYRGRIPVEVSR